MNGCYPISHFVPAAGRSRLMNNKRKFHKKKERKKTRKKKEKRMNKKERGKQVSSIVNTLAWAAEAHGSSPVLAYFDK